MFNRRLTNAEFQKYRRQSAEVATRDEIRTRAQGLFDLAVWYQEKGRLLSLQEISLNEYKERERPRGAHMKLLEERCAYKISAGVFD